MKTTFAGSRRAMLLMALATCAGAVAISACDDDNNGPANAISVAVVPTQLTLVPGASGTAEVAVTRNGTFTGPVTLAASGQPASVDITLNPGQLDANTATATATVTVGPETPVGPYPITVTAAGNGVADASTTMNLVVQSEQGASRGN